MGKYLKGNIDEQLSLTTLAARTIATAQFGEVVNERTYVSSMLGSWSLRNATPGTNVGPIIVGVAHGDYTGAEIEAVIEATNTWNEGDVVASREVGKRLIRIVGTLPVPSGLNEQSRLNDGRKIRTRLGWILNQGQTLQIWAYNQGQGAFATTVPVVDLNGHANLWPR